MTNEWSWMRETFLVFRTELLVSRIILVLRQINLDGMYRSSKTKFRCFKPMSLENILAFLVITSSITHGTTNDQFSKIRNIRVCCVGRRRFESQSVCPTYVSVRQTRQQLLRPGRRDHLKFHLSLGIAFVLSSYVSTTDQKPYYEWK